MASPTKASLAKARAALLALREPTEGMSDQIIFSKLGTIAEGEYLWRAMIDAALGEQ
jgi:hypothetical protein